MEIALCPEHPHTSVRVHPKVRVKASHGEFVINGKYGTRPSFAVIVACIKKNKVVCALSFATRVPGCPESAALFVFGDARYALPKSVSVNILALGRIVNNGGSIKRNTIFKISIVFVSFGDNHTPSAKRNRFAHFNLFCKQNKRLRNSGRHYFCIDGCDCRKSVCHKFVCLRGSISAYGGYYVKISALRNRKRTAKVNACGKVALP